MKRALKASKVINGLCETRSFDSKAVKAAAATLPNDHDVSVAAEYLGMLAHPLRLRLLAALNGRELCVCDCAQVLGAKMPATSQHLRELRRIGAITFRAEGKMAYYRIADRRWIEIAQAAHLIVQQPVLARASA
jgi:DNA-binding transcriptional ArsR family regulator